MVDPRWSKRWPAIGAILALLLLIAGAARARAVPSGPAGSLDGAAYVGGTDLDALDDATMGEKGELIGGGRTYSDDIDHFVRPDPQPTPASPRGKEGIVAKVARAGLAHGTGLSEAMGTERVRGPHGQAAAPRAAWTARFSAAAVEGAILGGREDDYVEGVARAVDGRIWVVGSTSSADFPIVNALQPEPGGGDAAAGDAFLARLSPDLTRIEYSSFLGGGDWEEGLAIGLAADGGPVVAGLTSSRDFPTRGGPGLAAPCAAGRGSACPDLFVARFAPDGRSLVWSTVLGGEALDVPEALAIDAAGRIVLAGVTVSRDFPVARAFQARISGGSCGGSARRDCDEAFVTVIEPDGGALAWSTFLGGRGDDRAHDVATDALGRVYLAGRSSSTDFPTASAFQARPGGGTCQGAVDRQPCGDAFVTAFDADGQRLHFSSYLGGRGDDTGFGLAVDDLGRVAIVGQTGSRDFPLRDPLQADFAGGETDAFFSVLDGAGALLASSYLGGPGDDAARAISAAGALAGGFAIAGEAGRGFPSFAPLPGFAGGDTDAFIGRIAVDAPAPVVTPTVPGAEPSPTPPGPTSTRPVFAPAAWAYLPFTSKH